jgi:hypothetical protein
VAVAQPDLATLRFPADECRRIVRLQFEAGNELADKAEALVKVDGVVFGLVLTAIGLAGKDHLRLPQWPWGLAVVLAVGGPVLLFLSMLVATWAFKAVDFEIGLNEGKMAQAVGFAFAEDEALVKAVESYTAGIAANRRSVNKVESLVTAALALLAAGLALLLASGLTTWLLH